MTTDTQTLDQTRVEAFMGKTLGDAAGLFASVLAIVGDRLGLFRALADHGPASADELAERAAVDERYALEWLRGMHAAGTLELGGFPFAFPSLTTARLHIQGSGRVPG